MAQTEIFHQSMAKVLLVSQIFTLIPVIGIMSKDVQHLHYRWLSVRTVYTTLILVLNALEFGVVMRLLLNQGLNFHHSGTLSLYIVCMLEQVYFWRLATKWPFIMSFWRHAEEIFLRTPYRLYATFNMKIRINGYTFLILFSALVEHFLLVYQSYHKSELERTQCKWNITRWEALFRRERYHLYEVMPFHAAYLPLLEWINLTLAYVRSFTDAFIICLSIGLAARFHQLYSRIAAVNTKAMPALFWLEVREHYLLLKHLVRILNREVSPLIVLAFANNMYFICFQLFNSFQNIGVDFIAMLAFWYSLIFAIVRTGLTLFTAATLNDFTRKMSSALRDVPSRSWCLETQLFSQQLAVDITALSGDGFFFLTRRLILAMASTIITYELMVTDVINSVSIQRLSEQLSNDITALSGNGFFFLTRRLILAMVSTIVTYELMVSNIINYGSARQQTNFC